MNITEERIGNVAVEGGWDTYVQVKDKNRDSLDERALMDELSERHFYSGMGTGVSCNQLIIMKYPHREDAVVAILRYRYDA